jgi:8-amino-7-oxononanoate synthase
LAGVRAAQRRGARVYWFRHNDPSSLQSALRAAVNARHKVVVCAGVYPEGAEPAPLPEFAGLASTFGALLYVDDSHGIGIFGKGPATAHSPYGRGSGGLTRFLGLGPGRVVVGGTLGKAIGVPMAFIAGSKPLMDYIESVSETFVHSTPPSIVQVAAALKALHLHETEGDDRKRRLVSLVRRFQRGLQGQGITVESKGLFPIQTIPLTSAARAQQVCTLLQRRSVWPLLQLDPPDHRGGAVLRFVLTALHSASEVDLAIAALTESEALSPGTLARQTATEGVGRPRASRTT